MAHKTYQEWQASEKGLDKFLEIGDTVDEAMADEFVNVLPPATMTGTMVQIGEAYNHALGRATYATLSKISGQWTWMGHCHRGKTEDLTNCREW